MLDECNPQKSTLSEPISPAYPLSVAAANATCATIAAVKSLRNSRRSDSKVPDTLFMWSLEVGITDDEQTHNKLTMSDIIKY